MAGWPPVAILSNRLSDDFQKIRYAVFGSFPVAPRLAFLDITDSSLASLGAVRYDRVLNTRVFRALSGLDIEAVLLDVNFAGYSDSEIDADLADAVKNGPTTILPVVIVPGKPPRLEGAFPGLRAAAAAVGHIVVEPDTDGVYRRYPLERAGPDGNVDSLALAAARVLGKIPDTSRWKTDAGGTIAIPYFGPWEEGPSHYTIDQVVGSLADAELREGLRNELEGQTVVLSDASYSGKDYGSTPFESRYPLGGIHMNVLNALLLDRPFRSQGLPEKTLLLLCPLLVLTLSVLGGSWRSFVPLGIALPFAIAGYSVFRFQFSMVVPDPFLPLLGSILLFLLLSLLKGMTESQNKEILRRNLGRFFAPAIVGKVLENDDALNRAERKNLAIMFTDIVRFSSWCAITEPEEIRATLNAYFSTMTEIVFRNGGTVDKFMGDGILAFFGDPNTLENPSLAALTVALEMQRAIPALAARFMEKNGLDLKIRIGINYGPVVVGSIGSEHILEYTVLGTQVNLAQRLESNAEPGGILISDSVFRMIDGNGIEAGTCAFSGPYEIELKGSGVQLVHGVRP